MHSFFSDLRFAIRSFARQPGATALVIITLALAVGANTAVFALVDAVFFRPLPYPNANRLVDLNEMAPKWGLDFTGINYPDFDQWRKASRSFEAMALWSGSSFNVSDGSERRTAHGPVRHVRHAAGAWAFVRFSVDRSRAKRTFRRGRTS